MTDQQQKIPAKVTQNIDLIFAILLLITTLSTAICVYQATRWNGVQAVDFGESARYRGESIKTTTLANSQIIVDVLTFQNWVNAVRRGDLVEAEFLKERFREEFKPAFVVWIAQSDGTNPIPPGTPFDLPEYTVARYNESAQLEEKAAAAFNEGKAANTNGDRYISLTILFAIVLFFCGIYSRWDSVKIRMGILLSTLFVFSFALYSLVSLLLRLGFI